MLSWVKLFYRIFEWLNNTHIFFFLDYFNNILCILKVSDTSKKKESYCTINECCCDIIYSFHGVVFCV